MSNVQENESGSVNRDNSVWQNKRVRRWIIYAAVLLIVFLAGLVPMWLTARTRARESEAAQASLRISRLQNSLANAAIDSRRGEYEPARQAASDFFTNLRLELDGRDSVLNETQRNALRPLLNTRDDVITLLARSDPASVDRLADLYTQYRQATEGTPVKTHD